MSRFGDRAKQTVKWCERCRYMTYWNDGPPYGNRGGVFQCQRCIMIRSEKRRSLLFVVVMIALFVYAVAKAARLF